MTGAAEISPCGLYRYTLWRWFGMGDRTVRFIGLNPSTADANQDDPTIRRCADFARRWGFDRLCMVNLFAYRATDPRELPAAAERGVDVIGPENDDWLRRTDAAALTVAAWGNMGWIHGRDAAVSAGRQLHYLRLTALGAPGHPLYLPATLAPQPWSPSP